MKIRLVNDKIEILSIGDEVVYLAKKDERVYNYLANVLRVKRGEIVWVFNGKDPIEYRCEIVVIDKKSIVLRVAEVILYQIELNCGVSLAFGLPKGQALDEILVKCTEIGLRDFYPLITEFSQRKEINLLRCKNLIYEAVEQCERVICPVLHDVCPLDKMDFAGFDEVLVCDEFMKGQQIARYDGVLSRNKLILIGPEGGFGERDRAIFDRVENLRRVSLGDNVLKASTAAVVATFMGVNGMI